MLFKISVKKKWQTMWKKHNLRVNAVNFREFQAAVEIVQNSQLYISNANSSVLIKIKYFRI